MQVRGKAEKLRVLGVSAVNRMQYPKESGRPASCRKRQGRKAPRSRRLCGAIKILENQSQLAPIPSLLAVLQLRHLNHSVNKRLTNYARCASVGKAAPTLLKIFGGRTRIQRFNNSTIITNQKDMKQNSPFLSIAP